MKRITKWFVRIFAGLFLFVIVLAILLFEKIDRTPYQEMPYYKRMSAQLDTFKLDTINARGNYLKVGWTKISITPSKMPNLAGYGIRGKADCINDSVYARVFVFDNGKKKVAFISLDLLIFPPAVKTILYQQFEKVGYKAEDLYFSATHTHSAPGGWAKGLAGHVLAGKYDEEYVNQLVVTIINSIRAAEKNLETATIGISKIEAENTVRNRINMPDSKIDPWIRVLHIEKISGKKACLVTYSAHANCLKIENTCISNDYPGRMISTIEKSGKVDFVMYAAGMVGSHIPTNEFDLENNPYVRRYGDSIAGKVIQSLDNVVPNEGNIMSTARLDLHLREPHLKIAKNWRIKPWVFDWLFGDYYPKMKILKINNIIFIGTPCDFSGELMKDFESICREKKIELYITSFNGGYIGYVNADKYYDEDKAETRDMNWFGPYNQAYFTEIIQRILRKI